MIEWNKLSKANKMNESINKLLKEKEKILHGKSTKKKLRGGQLSFGRGIIARCPPTLPLPPLLGNQPDLV